MIKSDIEREKEELNARFRKAREEKEFLLEGNEHLFD